MPPSLSFRSKNILFLFALVISLIFLAFSFQGSRAIYTPDEGFYVGIGQAMLETGDYLIPRLQDEPWLDKPPLSMWGIAAGIGLLGQNEFGARAFHALTFLFTIFLVFLLGRSLYSRREGLFAAVIYATMAIPFVSAHITTPDSPLTLWTTASFYFFWKSVEPGARRESLWKILMCTAFGLGFLTKGPAAIIPSGAMFVFLLVQRRALRYFLSPWVLVGGGLFCLLGLGWYAVVSIELPGALDYFLDNQLIGRTISGKYDRNPGILGSWIYLPLLLFGTLPWSVIWWPTLRRRGTKLFHRPFWTELKRDPQRLFLFLWVAVPVLALCLASSKLPLYVLPVFPALALLTARLWPCPPRAGVWRDNPLGISRATAILVGILFLALPAVKFASSHYPAKEDMRALAAALQEHLPEKPYEVIAVSDHLEALGFYDVHHVERVSIFDEPYPFFVLPRHLAEKIASMQTSDHTHVFVCREDWQISIVTRFLDSAGAAYEEIQLPFFNTRVFLCPPSRSDPHDVRLIVLGDPGTGAGKSRALTVASALHLLDVEKSLRDGVLLLGGALNGRAGDTVGWTDASRREVETSFADLLLNGVPFYSVSGPYDSAQGLEGFKGETPLKGMKSLHGYAPLFGKGLVQVFFPGPASRGGSPPLAEAELRNWLRQSLEKSSSEWKVVALQDPGPESLPEAPSSSRNLTLPDETVPEAHGGIILLQGTRCSYAPPSSADPGNVAKAFRLLFAPEESVAFLMLEFDRSAFRITAFDRVGAATKTVSVPAQ